MTCGLSSTELILLFYLFRKRCLSEKHSRSILAIERDFAFRIDVETTVRSLQNKGYLGCKKKEKNYWADPGRTIAALAAHGYSPLRGAERLQQDVNSF